MQSWIADRSWAVTPSDSAGLGVDAGAPHARYLYITTGGTLKFVDANGVDQTITVAAGFFWCTVAKVWSTGTSASGIIAFY